MEKIIEELKREYNIENFDDEICVNLSIEDSYYSTYPVEIKIEEDHISVTVSLDFEYGDELSTEKVLKWVEDDIKFYFYKDNFRMTKTYSGEEFERVDLDMIKNWVIDLLNRGI